MSASATSEPRWNVWAALIAVQVFFGVHYVAAKEILFHLDPAAWAAVRILTAALLLEAFVLGTGREIPREARDWRSLIGFCLCGVVFNQILFVEGLSRTVPSHSSLINTTIPVWAVFFAWILRHELLTARKVGGLLLAITGAWLLQAGSLDLGEGIFTGDLLTLLNSISYGLFLVVSRRYLQRHDPLSTIAHVFALGAVGITIYGAPALVRTDWSEVPPVVWGWAAFVVLFPTIGSYYLAYWALARVRSSVVALFIYLQPLIATSLGAWLLGSWPTPLFYASAALVLTGVGIVATSPRSREVRYPADSEANRTEEEAP